MIDLSKFKTGKYVNTTRVVKSNKDGLIDWLEREIVELKSRKTLKLKDVKNTNGLYERRGWSRPSKDGKDNVRIRLEVRGKSVFLNEDSCKDNESILCNNNYDDVLSTMKELLKMVEKEKSIPLYYRVKGEVREL